MIFVTDISCLGYRLNSQQFQSPYKSSIIMGLVNDDKKLIIVVLKLSSSTKKLLVQYQGNKSSALQDKLAALVAAYCFD